MGALEVNKVDEKAVFALHARWNQLVRRSGSGSFFSTWEWLWTWWKFYSASRRLYTLIVQDEREEIIGIAPLFLAERTSFPFGRFRELRFLGTDVVSSDYLDFILCPEREEEVLDSLVRFLVLKKDEWDVLFVSDIRDDAPTLGTLRALLSRHSLLHYWQPAQVCPYIDLPSNWQSYESTLSRKARSNLRYYTKTVEQSGGARFEIENSPERLSSSMRALFRLHEMRWQSRGQEGHFLRPFFTEFGQEVAAVSLANGNLQLCMYRVEDQPVAALLGFSHRGVFYYYQSGFDPAWTSKSIGTVLLARCIRHAIETRHQRFDFLRGIETYKERLSTGTTRTVTGVVAHRRGGAYLMETLETARKAARRKLKTLLPRTVVNSMQRIL